MGADGCGISNGVVASCGKGDVFFKLCEDGFHGPFHGLWLFEGSVEVMSDVRDCVDAMFVFRTEGG